MKISTVALIGVGAVGSYFYEGLRDRLQDHFCVVASGEREKRLKEEGLIINGRQCYPKVCTPKQAHGADLLLIAVKYGALGDILDDVKQIVDEHTLVISLLNGVDSEEIIGAHIGMEHMIFSVMKIASERKGNQITYNPEQTWGVTIGEPGYPDGSERARAIAQLFDGTPVRYRISKDIMKEIWQKYAFNVSWNLPQAIWGVGIGVYAQSSSAAFIRKKMRDEVCAVAAAQDIDISEYSDIEKMIYPSAPTARYSTLQDLDAGRKTEIEMLGGAMIRLGEKYNVPVPYCTFAYHAIRVLEQINDGTVTV